MAAMVLFSATIATPQGETTSAITGQVSDPSGAALAGATVRLKGIANGIERTAQTGESGRFNFPQLKPGIYTLKAEATGFGASARRSGDRRRWADQNRVDSFCRWPLPDRTLWSLRRAPLMNHRKRQHATTSLGARVHRESAESRRRHHLSGAVRCRRADQHRRAAATTSWAAQNGYGNVQFNGLPALSNGYIVDGLETNDPLTNLNSGLSTNLVLGLNSIAEVTVNTLSYAVDQGRYGASQVNYVTKSGTNRFHGNLYELWNGSKFERGGLLHQRHAGKS